MLFCWSCLSEKMDSLQKVLMSNIFLNLCSSFYSQSVFEVSFEPFYRLTADNATHC